MEEESEDEEVPARATQGQEEKAKEENE